PPALLGLGFPDLRICNCEVPGYCNRKENLKRSSMGRGVYSKIAPGLILPQRQAVALLGSDHACPKGILYQAFVQISHLSVASSQVELVEDKSTNVSIQNASVIFKGTLGRLEGSASPSLPVEQMDTCVNLDSGISMPRWTKQLFADFISFTLKLVLKGQHCHPHVALPLFWSPFQPGEPPALSAPDLQRDLHHLQHHSQLSPDKGCSEVDAVIGDEDTEDAGADIPSVGDIGWTFP
ncbi:hypothetical protein E2I00_019452, partial [Balaenoptera physalus]